MKNYFSGPIMVKSKAFAIRIVRFCELLEQKKRYSLARQLMDSGTSIGANVFEAQHCESLLDFIHKMKIASKEASETCFWLELCKECYPDIIDYTLIEDCNEILKLLNKIISTSKSRLNDRAETRNGPK